MMQGFCETKVSKKARCGIISFVHSFEVSLYTFLIVFVKHFIHFTLPDILFSHVKTSSPGAQSRNTFFTYIFWKSDIYWVWEYRWWHSKGRDKHSFLFNLVHTIAVFMKPKNRSCRNASWNSPCSCQPQTNMDASSFH